MNSGLAQEVRLNQRMVDAALGRSPGFAGGATVRDLFAQLLFVLASWLHLRGGREASAGAGAAEAALPERLRVFISHSHDDRAVTQELVDLLRYALNLRPEQIRCTGVEGFQLPAGTETDQQLRIEVFEADVLIAVISPNSLGSFYVMFELGARWGAGKPLLPLLLPSVDPAKLERPLDALHALRCDSAAQLNQLVIDVARRLDLRANDPGTFQRQIESLQRSVGGP